ncbi:hypothetical protein Mpt1_c02590 [Candidatus Methanoplasma termitum]|uniref:Uncharacterized protein n=1 Tax=Candidatus Methanoplasma termitum TaxID=1577791 RepID=A0A0A7LAR5_9ARCH|nr:hypothetical protein [Candidatus Methanoplasma termitum]AIZ56159.1 hypothetical protein Mpt1_c02590 [Candidatus Methanoplasma termitum]
MKKVILVSVGIVLLFGIVGTVSFVTDADNEQSTASPLGADQFDLAAALENAVSGDTIEMRSDASISDDLTINQGVILKDMGFSLTVQRSSVLIVSGELISTGDLSIKGIVSVVDGGCLTIENNGNSTDLNKKTATVTGTVNIYGGGTLNVGLQKESYLIFSGNGKLWVGGAMKVGDVSIFNYSAVDVVTASITGTLNISTGSAFRVADVLTVGIRASFTTDMSSSTVVSGVVTLDPTACVIVYGEAGFNKSNIKYSVVLTKFIFDNKYAYATEYKSITGNRTLVFPPTDNLIDCVVEKWKDAGGNVLSPDSAIQIGTPGYTSIYGEVSNKIYNVTLSKDDSIKWVKIGNNGVTTELQGVIAAPYNTSFTISMKAVGDAPLPTMYMNGTPCDGASVSFKVAGNVTLTTSNDYKTESSGGLSSLIIVLVIIIAIMAIALVVLILKYRKRTGA